MIFIFRAKSARIGVVMVVFDAGEEVGEVWFFFAADGDGGEVGLRHGASASRSGGGDNFGLALDLFLKLGCFFLQIFWGLIEHFEDGDEV